MVDTKLWHDSWVRKLKPLERYLFLYLLTNDKCSFCGIYELPVDIMAFEVDIEQKELVKEMLPRLEPKIFYREDWVYIPNFKKHHVNSSVNNIKGYEAAINEVPSHIFDMFKGLSGEFRPLEGASSPLDTSASALASTTKDNKLSWYSKIENKHDEYRKLINSLAEKDYYSKTELHNIIVEEFIPHFREKSEKGKKEEWEKKTTWDYKARIRTWIRNTHKYQKDYQCKDKKVWHRVGEKCHCKKTEKVVKVEIKNGVAHVVKKMSVKN